MSAEIDKDACIVVEIKPLKTVLLIDDESDILSTLARALDNEGVAVATFDDPIEALNAFRANPMMYDLVVSDVRMAGMSGIELVVHLKRLKPDIKILLMSAFEMIEETDKYPIVGLLSKPFSMTDFSRTILELLNDDKNKVDIV